MSFQKWFVKSFLVLLAGFSMLATAADDASLAPYTPRQENQIVVLSNTGRVLSRYTIITIQEPNQFGLLNGYNSTLWLGLQPNGDGVEHFVIRFTQWHVKANLTRAFAVRDRLMSSETPITLFVMQSSIDGEFDSANYTDLPYDEVSQELGSGSAKHSNYFVNLDQLKFADFDGKILTGEEYASEHPADPKVSHIYVNYREVPTVERPFNP